MAADQRYCLQCGARRGAPRVDVLVALDPPIPPISAVPAPLATARRRRPPRPLVAALALLGLAGGGALGAAIGPGPSTTLAARATGSATSTTSPISPTTRRSP
jgi:hypothetical protein